jgi:hypothetical protein
LYIVHVLSLHLLVQKIKALELALGFRLEVIHVPGTTIITQGTDGLSRGICANYFNTDIKYFALEVFLPALPSLSLTKWALIHIGIYEDYETWWNVETDTISWEPQNLMHNNTLWVLSPGVAIQGFTAAIMAWVFTPFFSTQDSTEDFWVCQQTCEIHWAVQGDTLGKDTLTSCPFCSVLNPAPPYAFFETLQ